MTHCKLVILLTATSRYCLTLDISLIIFVLNYPINGALSNAGKTIRDFSWGILQEETSPRVSILKVQRFSFIEFLFVTISFSSSNVVRASHSHFYDTNLTIALFVPQFLLPPARFFLACSDRTGSTFEMFLLCTGNGGTMLDEYVVSPGQIYAERLQAKSLRLVCGTIRETMEVSALNLRRDALWASLSLEHNCKASGISPEDVRDMCQLCSQTSLSDIDPRLSDLLGSNDDDDVGIKWQNILFSMKQDPVTFSHCIVVQTTDGNAMAHLFHFAKDEMFVYFELSSETGKMLAANLVLREENKPDLIEAAYSRKCKALELVTNWILYFIWHNL